MYNENKVSERMKTRIYLLFIEGDLFHIQGRIRRRMFSYDAKSLSYFTNQLSFIHNKIRSQLLNRNVFLFHKFHQSMKIGTYEF